MVFLYHWFSIIMKMQINERAFLQDLPEANAVRLRNWNILIFFFLLCFWFRKKGISPRWERGHIITCLLSLTTAVRGLVTSVIKILQLTFFHSLQASGAFSRRGSINLLLHAIWWRSEATCGQELSRSKTLSERQSAYKPLHKILEGTDACPSIVFEIRSNSYSSLFLVHFVLL